jgi:hypothetical protein
MSLWTIAEEKRIAALAARDAFWRILERHMSRMELRDNSLQDEKEGARVRMIATESGYSLAMQAALKSGEPHPEDSDGC